MAVHKQGHVQKVLVGGKSSERARYVCIWLEIEGQICGRGLSQYRDCILRIKRHICGRDIFIYMHYIPFVKGHPHVHPDPAAMT
jgi:hypothetical protein